MNVYDFDKTIFYPDSTKTFLIYCFRHYPTYFFKSLSTSFSDFYNWISTGDITTAKEGFFAFLKFMPDIDKTVDDFWNKNFSGIQQWYLERKKDDDLIISASPEFLLKPVAKRLGCKLIATDMDKHSGKIKGLNCKGEEKIRRFRAEFGETKIDKFYSDSLTDKCLAEIASSAYLVDHEKINPWP